MSVGCFKGVLFMKVLLKILILAILVVVLVGCRSDTLGDEQPDIPPYPSEDIPPEPPPSESSVIGRDPNRVPPYFTSEPPHEDWSQLCYVNSAWLLSELDALLDRDNGALWGVHLRRPLMIADTITREVVANMPDIHGNLSRLGDIYIGTLSQNEFIGTTTTFMYDQWWGMITWGFIENHSDDLGYVMQVMVHKLFHAWQRVLFGGEPGQRDNAHMDELDARISVRLEINALMKALGSSGDDRLAAISDALSIRAERRRNHGGAATGENYVEILEGTAVYTHTRLTVDALSDIITLMDDYMNAQITGYSMRMFGNMTGALYGFLLDELGADWKPGLRFDSDLGALLQEAAEITQLTPFEDLELELYGYAEITAFETAWVESHILLRQTAQEVFEKPVLMVPSDGDFKGLDGVQLLNISDSEYVYFGNFIFEGVFGRLTVANGFLLFGRTDLQYGVSALNISIDESTISGTGWIIELSDFFEVREIGVYPNHHFVVVRG